MTTAVFDTLKASRKLKAAGMDEAHAEAIVQSMAEAFEDTVATKADIARLEASTKADIATVKAELKTEIAELKADLKVIKYFFGPVIVLLLLKIAFL